MSEVADEGTSGPMAAEGVASVPLVAERARARMGPAPVPFDEALPLMSRVLDLEVMAKVIHPLLKPGPPLELAINALRYKPGRRLCVHYKLGERRGWSDAVLVTGAERDSVTRAARPGNRALARAADGRTPALSPLVQIPELDAMLFFLPLDPSLPTLAEPPAALWRRLEAAGVRLPSEPSEPRPLGYRARRRAVVRVGDHVLKFYSSSDAFGRALEGFRMTSGIDRIRTAPLEAAFPEVGITAQSFIQGPTPPPGRHTAERVGALLAGLHSGDSSRLPGLPASRQLLKVSRRVDLLCAVAPALRRRVRVLFDTLAATEPQGEALVASHGDMHASQLIDVGEHLALIDFDSACAAPPALDLAAYACRSVRRNVADLEVGLAVLDALIEGYGRRPLGLGWFLSSYLLRRASSSFHHLDDDWLQRVEAMVLAAEEARRL